MSSIERGKGRAYWRSLDELAETPEFRSFVEKEFPDLAGEMLAPPNRRSFIKLMGASVAMAGLTACRWPQEKIVPYARQPEGRLAGVPVQYATSWELGGHGIGLLATSYDGRPIKIDGNPEHPMSLGGASAFIQALVLELYDPDRSTHASQRGEHRSWDEFETAFRGLFANLRGQAGRGLAVLSEATSSPTTRLWREKLLGAFPQMRWYEYETISRDNERDGLKQVYGRPLRPQLLVDRADLVVSFDADLLWDHPAALRHARQFGARRRATDGTMNRLHAVESTYSLTGAAADHRHLATPAEIETIALTLAGAGSGGGSIATELERELASHRGRALVVAGPRQPAAVHAAVALINAKYGAVGNTIGYTRDVDEARPAHIVALTQLVSEMRAGSVETLLICGGNPVYDAPVDLDFAGALGKVANSIRLGLYEDETSRACQWHVARAHTLESWGDTRAWDGTVSITQPLIEPLYGGKTVPELLAMAIGEPIVKGLDLVRGAHAALDDRAWRRALHDGVVAGSAFALETLPTIGAVALGQAASAPSSTALDVLFVADMSTYDGRFANNAWLQENPDPLTKLVWDNAALIAPATADSLGLKQSSMAKLTVGGRSLDIAIYVMPGIAPNVVVLPLGYGRKLALRVATDIGFDSYAVRSSQASTIAHGATLQATTGSYELVSTQDHWAIDDIGRREIQHRLPELAREGTLAEYKANPTFAAEGKIDLFNLWKEHPYDGHRWGMAIDLTACIGCGACTVACQAENNIPVVGKDQVQRGREMHWIRLDRYFKGDPERAGVVFQPVTCMHCENAPCEQVCPVAATVHDQEGLNVMVYNRCIGTRYCSNNCPYKVRRFNYYNWHKTQPPIANPLLKHPTLTDTPLTAMVYNPEVTVRARGVMEKCTYCVQRINAVKINAKNDRRPIKDGEIVSACEQTCPTQAITFGDLNDPASRVRKLQASDRAYMLLQEINTRPRTQYLARLKNPAGDAAEQPAAKEGHA